MLNTEGYAIITCGSEFHLTQSYLLVGVHRPSSDALPVHHRNDRVNL